MKVTRAEFFNKATEILFRERCVKDFTYRQAIIQAQKELGLSRTQLRELCSNGTEAIEV